MIKKKVDKHKSINLGRTLDEMPKIMSMREEVEAVSVFMKYRLDIDIEQTVNPHTDRLSRFQFLDFILLLAVSGAFDLFRNKKTSRFHRAETMMPDAEGQQIDEDKGVNKKDLKVAEVLKVLLEDHFQQRTTLKMRIINWRTNQLWTKDINALLEP